MNCEKCGRLYSKVDFVSKSVVYCAPCLSYHILDLKCEHNYISVLFELSNNTTQLRQVCNKCWHRSPNPLKQVNIDTSKIRKTTEASFQKFKTDLHNEEQLKINEVTAPLKQYLFDNFKKDYTEYIESEKWKRVRAEILKRDFGNCQICGLKAEQVHHLTYAHFKIEYPFELVSLCAKCHKEEYH